MRPRRLQAGQAAILGRMERRFYNPGGTAASERVSRRDMTPTNQLLRGEAEAVLDDLKASTGFLTRLPGWLGPDAGASRISGARRAYSRWSARWSASSGGAVLVHRRWLHIPPLVAAALAVLATMILTGGLHEDGLADTVDGFGGGATAARKLEIMDDSRIGTFGVAALVFSILFRVAALASLMPLGAFRAALVLVAAEAVSRAAMVRLWQELPAARLGGLAHETGPPDQQAMVVALVIGLVDRRHPGLAGGRLLGRDPRHSPRRRRLPISSPGCPTARSADGPAIRSAPASRSPSSRF